MHAQVQLAKITHIPSSFFWGVTLIYTDGQIAVVPCLDQASAEALLKAILANTQAVVS
jgi:hypothetical protein